MIRSLTIPVVGGFAVMSKFSQTVQLLSVFGAGSISALLIVSNGAGQTKIGVSTGLQQFTEGVTFFSGACPPAPVYTSTVTGTIDPVTGVVAVTAISGLAAVDFLSVPIPPEVMIEVHDTVTFSVDAFSESFAIFIVEDFDENED